MQSQNNTDDENIGEKTEISLELSEGVIIKSEEISDAIIASLDDDKAEDIICIDLKGKSSIADFMVIASGRSNRHVAALADHVTKKLKELGFGRAKVQGLPNADWVLIDSGDVITHIFKPEVRAFYDIERIWKDDVAANKA